MGHYVISLCRKYVSCQQKTHHLWSFSQYCYLHRLPTLQRLLLFLVKVGDICTHLKIIWSNRIWLQNSNFSQQIRDPWKFSSSTCPYFSEEEGEFFLLIVSTIFAYLCFLLSQWKALRYTCFKKKVKTFAKMLADFTISIIIECASQHPFTICGYFSVSNVFSERQLCLGGHFLWHFLAASLKRLAWDQACLWKSKDLHLSIPDCSLFLILTTRLQCMDFKRLWNRLLAYWPGDFFFLVEKGK